MKQRIEKFTLKEIQHYHHSTLIQFDDQETLVEALANRIGFSGANPIAFLSVIARRPEIRINDIEEALLNDRTLVRANCFRNSLSLIASVDYPIYFRALNQLLVTSNLSRLNSMGVGSRELARARYRLEESNFKISKSIEEIIDIIYSHNRPRPKVEAQQLIIRKFCEAGILVRTYSKGWKGNNFLYALAKNWFPDFKLGSENQESARSQLIRRYIDTYGPVSKEDIQFWTGLTATQTQRGLGNLRRELTQVSVENHKEELFLLKERLPVLRNPASVQNNIVFLPPFDPYACGWLNKKRTCRKVDFPYIFDRTGNSAGTIVWLGKSIGLWQFRDAIENVFEYHLFESFGHLALEVEFLAERYAKVLAKTSGNEKVELVERPLPSPLNKRDAGSFLWPLGRKPLARSSGEFEPSPMDRRNPNTFRHPYLNDSASMTS